jgi:hypothetical protein
VEEPEIEAARCPERLDAGGRVVPQAVQLCARREIPCCSSRGLLRVRVDVVGQPRAGHPPLALVVEERTQRRLRGAPREEAGG